MANNALNATIYLIRHGHTSLNTGSANQERFRAWSNPPLNEEGLMDAQKAGQFMSNKGIAHIFSSDLGRTMQTAQAVHQATGAPITPMHGLRPWNIGKFTGELVEPNEKEVQRYQDHPNETIPGGESYNTFLQRNNMTLHHIAMFSNHIGQPVAAVLHTRNVNAVKGQVKGLERIPMSSMVPPGGVVRLDVRNGKIGLKDLDPEEGMKDEHKHFQE